MSEEFKLVGGSIFGEIKPDPRVTSDLAVCLYCKISHKGPDDEIASYNDEIDYQIPLDCCKGNEIKQCPACKTIYILKDPTE